MLNPNQNQIPKSNPNYLNQNQSDQNIQDWYNSRYNFFFFNLKISLRFKFLFFSRASTRRHAPSRASTASLTSSLTSALTACWRHCLRHPLTSPSESVFSVDFRLTVDFDWPLTVDRWPLIVDFFRVDFFSPGSPYPVFRVDFIFAVCFCILCL